MGVWKKGKNNRIKQAVAALLAALLVVGGADGLLTRKDMDVWASSPALPGIEQQRSQIVENNQTYRILEIAPDNMAGEIGFYIGGQEAFPSLWNGETSRWMKWRDKLATFRTSQSRAEFMKGLKGEYDRLAATLGSDSQRILSWVNYEEVGEVRKDEAGVSALTIEIGRTKGVFRYKSGGAYQEGEDWNVAFSVADSSVTLEDIAGVHTEGENAGKVISLQPYYKLVGAVPLTRGALRELAENDATKEIYLYQEAGVQASQAYYALAGDAEELWNQIKDQKIVSGGDAGTNPGSGDTGNSGTGSGGTGSGDTSNSGTGSGGTGSGDTGNSGTGSGGTGSGDTGNGGTGSGGTGSGDTGNGGTGNGDTGNSSTGSEGAGNSGTGGSEELITPPDDSMTGIYRLEFAFIQPGESLDGTNRVYKVNTDYTTFQKGRGSYSLVETGAEDKGEEFVLPGETVWFKGGLVNSEIFRRMVWGLDEEESARFGVEVVTMTPGQLNELANLDEFLRDFQMLHVTSGERKGMILGEYFSFVLQPSLEEGVRDGLLKYFVGNKLPAIVDFSLVSLTIGEGYRDFVLPTGNIGMLACGLMLGLEAWDSGIGVQNIKDDIGRGLDIDSDGSFVNQSIWMYRTPETPFLYSAFSREGYSEQKRKGGFEEVLIELRNENKIRENENLQTGNTPLLPDVVDDGAVWRYIINYRNRRISTVKTSLRVLEIQPATGSAPNVRGVALNQDMVRKWVGSQDVTVEIESMSISEFIGTIEDLNTRYDMIYIGSRPDGFYTQTLNRTVITDFNDNSMDGLLYSHVGDLVKGRVALSGLLDSDYARVNRRTYLKEWTYHRYAGNDLTPEKYNILMDYLDAQYPIVVADDLLQVSQVTQIRSVNGNRVDSSSYLYELLDKSLGRGNLFREGDIARGQNGEFAYAVNLPKIMLKHREGGASVSGVAILDGKGEPAQKYAPTPGELGASQVYQLKKLDGKYYLQFEFEIENAGAASYTTEYVANLYLDYNADGKFNAKNEKLSSFVITENDKQVAADALKVGTTYRVSREIPGDYYGAITWQIELTQKNNSLVRVTQKGYSRLQREQGDVARPIRILQIHYSNYFIDLRDNLAKGNTAFGQAYNLIKSDYNLSVDLAGLYNSPTEINFNTMSEADVLAYDMLIIGFSDGVATESKDAWSANAISNLKAFIASGKSVLMSHDTTSLANFDFVKSNHEFSVATLNDSGGTTGGTRTATTGEWFWGYNINKEIRNLVGMDTYGVQNNRNPLMNTLTPPINVDGRYEYNKKEAAYKPKMGKGAVVGEIQGYTAMMLNSRMSGSQKSYRVESSGAGNSTTTSVDRVNEGQITNYPFRIGEKVEIKPTHQQYYTLDMNQDKDGDNQTDMVVWYTLGGSKDYTITAKDVRNNYYIYSTGNIIYTGMGHSVAVTLDEAKLFLNTMIAAYQAGRKEGEISLYDENQKPTDVFYNYFGDVEGNLEDTFELDFRITDLNLVSGGKFAQVQFYMVAPEKSSGAVKLNLKGLETQNVWGRPLGLPIYQKDNDSLVGTSDNLQIDALYYVKIPVSELAASQKSGNRARLIVAYRSILRDVDKPDNNYGFIDWRSASVSFVNVELFNLD